MVREATARAALAVAAALLIGATIFWRSPVVIAGCCAAVAEAVFAVRFLVKQKTLDGLPTTPGPGHDAKALMRKCIARITYSDDYLSSWFDGVPREQIHKQNLREFMAYGFWFKQYDQLSDQDKRFMDQVLKQLEKQTGVVLPEGRNPNIHFLSHLWDPLKVSYKPLVFYILTEVLAWSTACLLLVVGFKRHCHKGEVFYTYRLGAVSSKTDGDSSAEQGSGNDGEPLLFIHGVGGGLLPYLLFVYKLMFTDRPLILPEYKHISMRYTSRVPTVEDCAQSVSEFLESVGVPSVHVMGHSYGTLVCARFAIIFADKVSSLALMDPVCFAMYMPRLIRTFLYAKSPNSGNWLLDQALLMVAKELHCAATFCRQFIWNDYNLWPERLPARTLVALSGGDVLCPAEDVKQYLEEETAARVLFHPTLHHGALLLWPSYADMVIKAWQQMLLDPAPAALAVLAAGADDLEAEPVHLHGTATAAAADNGQDEQLQQGEEEDEGSDDATVVLLDQGRAATPQQQPQQKKDPKQLQWHLQLQQQWQELQQSDCGTAAGLLQPSNKAIATAAADPAEGIRSSVGCNGISKNASLHSRNISECPSYASGDLLFLSCGLQELSEGSLTSESPLATSWSVNTDAEDIRSSSSGRSSIQCEQCGSLFLQQHQQQQRRLVPSSSSSSSSDDSWVGVDSLDKAEETAVTSSGGSCGKEQLAALCECCCQQQQWQQQVVEATCA